MTECDDELMRRSVAGDSGAFAALIRRWERPVGRVLRRLVPDVGDREDFRQEVFLRVFRAQAGYEPRGEFAAWLFRIVLNVVRDSIRRRRHRPSHLRDEDLDRSTDPQKLAEQSELRNVIGNAINRLPAPVREALVLKHFAELTFSQIATVTNTPISTVKSRAQQGLKQLRKELASHGANSQEPRQ